jgi:hypothetical protein
MQCSTDFSEASIDTTQSLLIIVASFIGSKPRAVSVQGVIFTNLVVIFFLTGLFGLLRLFLQCHPADNVWLFINLCVAVADLTGFVSCALKFAKRWRHAVRAQE